MSESVSNDGESYSGESGKYSRGYGRNSESPSGESHSSNWGASAPAPREEDKLSDIKKLLKEAEDFLVEYGRKNFSQVSLDVVRNKFRDLVVKNETSIIEYPIPNTLVGCYEAVYNTLPEKEKEDPQNKVLASGLHEFVVSKRQSKLKYW